MVVYGPSNSPELSVAIDAVVETKIVEWALTGTTNNSVVPCTVSYRGILKTNADVGISGKTIHIWVRNGNSTTVYTEIPGVITTTGTGSFTGSITFVAPGTTTGTYWIHAKYNGD